MAKYTEEQKKAVLARIPEIGMSKAAKEAGIPISTVSKWNKAVLSAKAEESVKAAVVKADAKLAKAKKKVQADKEEIKDKIEKKTQRTQEKKKTVKEKVKKPVKAVKTEFVFETSVGRQITPDIVAARVPKGVDAAYIKLEENKIYWVKGTETGVVDIWE